MPKPVSQPTAARVRWSAGKDGISHAHPVRGRAIRALCGAPAIDERDAWPARTRCGACLWQLQEDR